MKHVLPLLLVALLALAALEGAGAAPAAPGAASPPAASAPNHGLQQPTPPPEGEEDGPPVSLSVLLALVCIFNLSVVALAGSIGLRRHFDSINPDK